MPDLTGILGGITQIAGTVLPILRDTGVLPGVRDSRWDNYNPMPFPPGGPNVVAMPGGAPIQATPAMGTGFMGAAQGMISGGTCIGPQPRASIGWPNTVQFMDTTPSGNTRVMTYKNKGRALLYSDDLQACKRVKRVATRARRAAGGR